MLILDGLLLSLAEQALLKSYHFQQHACPAAIDINDITIEEIVSDLAAEKLAPASFGLTTRDLPKFPLQGMLWWHHKRPFFSMTADLLVLQVFTPAYDSVYLQSCASLAWWLAMFAGVNC